MTQINIDQTDMNILLINNINYLLDDFFKYIDENDIKIYLKKYNANDNYNNYIVQNISDAQIKFLKDNIIFSEKCLNKINANLTNKNNMLNYKLWKFAIFDDMFFNLPFTIQDVIFMPITYINSSMGNLNSFSDGINKKFSKTLVHEKIHLLQRYNQKQWNDYIIKNTNWILTNNKKINFNCSFFNNKNIVNPDTYYLNNIFLYKKDNNLYYGTMILNKNNDINNFWFSTSNENTENTEIDLYPTNLKISKYEHPYEELAYIMAQQLVYN